MTNLAQSWRPKKIQNRPQNVKKSILKNKVFSASIFGGIGPRFGRVFGRFLGPKMHGNCKNVILAKTLKIMLPSRRHANFQEIDVAEKPKKLAKIDEKLHVFWHMDFGGVLEGFWEGFGRPKSLIFALFSMFFPSHF